MAVTLAALDATVVVRGVEGERRIPFVDFHRLPGDTSEVETVLRPAELVTCPLRGDRGQSRREGPVARASKNVYACANIEIGHELVEVNTDFPYPMRAPGEAPGCFAMEATMDVRFLDRPDPHVDPMGARLR